MARAFVPESLPVYRHVGGTVTKVCDNLLKEISRLVIEKIPNHLKLATRLADRLLRKKVIWLHNPRYKGYDNFLDAYRDSASDAIAFVNACATRAQHTGEMGNHVFVVDPTSRVSRLCHTAVHDKHAIHTCIKPEWCHQVQAEEYMQAWDPISGKEKRLSVLLCWLKAAISLSTMVGEKYAPEMEAYNIDMDDIEELKKQLDRLLETVKVPNAAFEVPVPKVVPPFPLSRITTSLTTFDEPLM